MIINNIKELQRFKQITGIYKLTNKINNKIYFGKSLNLLGRIPQHKTGNKQVIDRAIHKYGFHNFQIEIVHTFDYSNNEELLWIEANYIECFESFRRYIGYNISRYGRDCTGCKQSKESNLKRAFALMGSKNHNFGKKFLPKEHPMWGVKMSMESKIKMSKAKQGKYDGDKNPNFDSNIYKLKNKITNQTFIGTRLQFKKQFSDLPKSSVDSMIRGIGKTAKGWILIS